VPGAPGARRAARVRAARPRLAGLLGVLLAGAAGVAIGALPAVPAGAAGRPLGLRFALDGYLGVEQAGNVLLSCPAGSADGGEPCAAAQGGGPVGNDDYPMSYVDVDSNPATVNSSTAQVQAPPGATIAFAGLYWGGDSGAANQAGVSGCQSTASAGRITPPPAPGRTGQVLLDVGGTGYVGVGASTMDTLPSSLGGATFQGFADVTRLFTRYSGATKVTGIPVTVANAQLAQGRNCGGGWSIVLVYTYPAGPQPSYAPGYRSVRLFDGLVLGGTGTPVAVTGDGFRVATDGGPVGARAGVLVYGADRNADDNQLSVNAVGTGNDEADATVAGSGYGAPLDGIGPTRPKYDNGLGYDSHGLDLPATALPAGATSGALALTGAKQPVAVGALLLVTRVDQLLGIASSVSRPEGTDAGYADVTPGTRLHYTLTLHGLAPVTAVAVTIPLPAGLAPVAGSLTLNGAPLDTGSLNTGSLNTGSLTGTSVGVTLPTLDPGTIAVIGYDVTPVNSAPAGVPLVSRATVRFTAAGVALVAYSPPATVLANRVDLALAQTAGTDAVSPGRPALLTVTVSNQGKVAATGVTVSDRLPDGLTLVSAHPTQGSYDATAGAWSIGLLAPAGSATLQVVVAPGAAPGTTAGPAGTTAPSAAPTASAAAVPPGTLVTWPAVFTAEISGGDQADLDSVAGDGLAGEDDQASVTLTVTAPAGVTAPAPSSGDVRAGVARTSWPHIGDVVTIVAALAGAALLLVGMMVLVSARARRY
jgi:uncharacterized repeat protein (TIGR01451 family)